jgi:hypothetical protein
VAISGRGNGRMEAKLWKFGKEVRKKVISKKRMLKKKNCGGGLSTPVRVVEM